MPNNDLLEQKLRFEQVNGTTVLVYDPRCMVIYNHTEGSTQTPLCMFAMGIRDFALDDSFTLQVPSKYFKVLKKVCPSLQEFDIFRVTSVDPVIAQSLDI